MRSTSQGSVPFCSSWLSGDAVIQVLSSTLLPGSKERIKPIGESSESPKICTDAESPKYETKEAGVYTACHIPDPISRDRDYILMSALFR